MEGNVMRKQIIDQLLIDETMVKTFVARMIDEPSENETKIKTSISAFPLIDLDYYMAKRVILNAPLKGTIKQNKLGFFEYRTKDANHFMLKTLLDQGEHVIKNRKGLSNYLLNMQELDIMIIPATEIASFDHFVEFFIKPSNSDLFMTDFAVSLTLLIMEKTTTKAKSELEKQFNISLNNEHLNTLIKEWYK